MNLVDANVLLYAINEDAVHHHDARRWLDESLSGAATVALSWVVLLAFVRLSTKAAIFPRPLSADQALDRVDAWLAQPTAVVVEPAADHLRIIRRLLGPLGTSGNLATDAHLAALAIEHRCTVVTYDADFTRFDGVRSATPSELLR